MIYACSDLHGCSPKVFQKLLDLAGFGEEDFLFVLGDVIDRGDHGTELLLWMTQQPNVQLILGNHEALMLTCSFLFEEVSDSSLEKLSLREIELLQSWYDNGGGPTLKGLRKLLKEDPDSLYGILDYLQDAPLFETVEAGGTRFILVHSGLGNFRPDKPLEDYTPQELLLDRPAPDARYFQNARVIFGHTPSVHYCADSLGRAHHTDTWTCIDAGAALGEKPLLLRLDDMQEIRIS